jgi:hypothetical protein
MAQVPVQQGVEEINAKIKGKGEAGARSDIAKILAAMKASTIPKVSTGKIGNTLVRFYDYGHVKPLGDHLILAAGPGVDPVVMLGSAIAKGRNGIYIATTPDSKAQADAEAAAKRASATVKAPAPKKADTPKPAPKPRAKPAPKATKAPEAPKAPWSSEAASLRYSGIRPRRPQPTGGEGEWESPSEGHRRMEIFRDLRARGRAQYQAKKAEAARPKYDKAAAMEEFNAFMDLLKKRKKGGQ